MSRLTKNPWYADEYLKSTWSAYIMHRDSMTKTIANSTDVKAIFEARVQMMATSSSVVVRRIRDLQAAKQRFSSTQKPASRFILYLPALVATATEVQARRAASDIGRRATEFLKNINEEALLTLAMLADAGDESSMVVRFFDTKDHDIADTPQMLGSFIDRISHLFLGRACLSETIVDGIVCHSYTSYTIDLLRTSPILLVCQEGKQTTTRTIGGPACIDDDMIDRCVARMAAWVRLATDTVHAEFPHWETLSAFGAFSLKLPPCSPFVRQSLDRLAQVFALDSQDTRIQYLDYYKMAKRHHDKGMTNFDAWVASLEGVVQSSGTVRSKHKRDAIHKLMARYGAFIGASTSNVERSFAALLDATGPRRASLAAHNMLTSLKLKLLEGGETEDTLIIGRASRIWMECFGLHKASGMQRRPHWVSGLPSKSAKSSFEKQFIRARRLGVTRRMTSCKRTWQDAADLATSARRMSRTAWADGHDKAR